MFNSRQKTARFSSLAQVSISEHIKVAGTLRNISITGCQAEFEKCLDLDAKETYGLRIFPEKDSGIKSFGLLCKVAWMKSGKNACSIGFSLEKSSDLAEFQSYLDFIEYSDAAARGIDRRVG